MPDTFLAQCELLLFSCTPRVLRHHAVGEGMLVGTWPESNAGPVPSSPHVVCWLVWGLGNTLGAVHMDAASELKAGVLQDPLFHTMCHAVHVY